MSFDLAATLSESAREEGFPLAGVVDLDQVDGTRGNPVFIEHARRYESWLARGYSGKMEYLVRGKDARLNPRKLFPDTRSVFCVARPYPRGPAGHLDESRGPRFARYLQGKDYHDEIRDRLDRVMSRARSEFLKATGRELKWKTCVDTSAVLERTWAALCGLGWIGKNTLLIHPQEGSYLFIGVALLSESTGQGPRLLPDYCGNCSRCMESCPTDAIPEPHWLDSNRCISYWTLEKKGALDLSQEDRTRMGTWVAGCDVCQEVCPFNIKPSRKEVTPAFENLGALENADWLSLIREDETSYRKRIQDSALSRVKPSQFQRNLAIALANAAGKNRFSSDELKAYLREIDEKLTRDDLDEIARAEWARAREALLIRSSRSRTE